MRHQSTQAIFLEWQRLATITPDRIRLPQRKDLKMSRLRGNVANLFFLELQKDVFHFRLAGTRPCTIYGRELKDTPLAALWNEGDRVAINELCDNVSSLQIPAASYHTAVSMQGRTVRFEMLLAPLAHEIGRDASLMGSIVVTEEAHWLGADPVVLNQLRTIEPIAPDLHLAEMDQAYPRLADQRVLVGAAWNSATAPTQKPDANRRFKVIAGGKA